MNEGPHFAGIQNSLLLISTIQDTIHLPASRSSSIDFSSGGKSGFHRRARPRRRPAAVIVLSGEDGAVRRPHDASGATINISSLDRAGSSVLFAPKSQLLSMSSLGTLYIRATTVVQPIRPGDQSFWSVLQYSLLAIWRSIGILWAHCCICTWDRAPGRLASGAHAYTFCLHGSPAAPAFCEAQLPLCT